MGDYQPQIYGITRTNQQKNPNKIQHKVIQERTNRVNSCLNSGSSRSVQTSF